MSLLNTKMQNMRKAGRLDNWEIRTGDYGGLMTFNEQTASPSGIITPQLAESAAISQGFTLETAVIEDNPSLTIGNTREVVIADAENTSRMVVFNFQTYTHGFTMVPSLYHNNEVGYNRDWEAKYKLTNRLYAEALDAACIAELESARTQVIAEPLLYTELADTLVAKYDQREEIIGDISTVMRGNDFTGEIYLVSSISFEKVVNDLMKYGPNNERDEVRQMRGRKFMYSDEVTNGVGKFATSYAVMQDTLGILFRHEREALAGRRTADGHEWSIDRLDVPNIPISTYYHETVGNYSAIAGAASADMDRVFKEHYGFAVDVAVKSAFISDTPNRATPVIKFQINRSETDSDGTSPTASVESSTDTLNFVLEFSEPVATDQQGTIISGDISDLFTIVAATPAGVAITSATASADGTQVTFVIADGSGNLINGDTVTIDASSIYDGAGNVFSQGDNPVATVNAGATAWV